MNETYPSYGGANFLHQDRTLSLRAIIPLQIWLLIPVLYLSMHGAIPILDAGGGGNNAITGTGVSGLAALFGMGLVATIALMCLAAMQPSYRVILATLVQNPLVAFLPALAILSTTWSQEPVFTFRKAILLVLSTLFAVYLARALRPRDLARLLMLAGFVAAILSILLCTALPSYGIDQIGQNAGSWQGIYPQKNSFGMALVYFLTPAYLPTEVTGIRRSHRILYSLLILALIGLARSRTAWVITVVYFALMMGLRLIGKFPRKQAVLILLIGLVIATGVGFELVNHSDNLIQSMGRDDTLSGRTVIWSAAYKSAIKQPLLGYGYEAFWLGAKGEAVNVLIAVRLSLTHAHNGLLNLWLELGAIGVVGFVFLVLFALRDTVTAFHARRTPFLDWYIGLIFLTLFYNIDESFLARNMDLLWILFLVGCLGLSEAARTARTAYRQMQYSMASMT